MAFAQFRDRGFQKRMGVVVVVLFIAQVAFHVHFRDSEPYQAAVSRYVGTHPAEAGSTYSLCFMCPKRMSYGAGTRIYKFSLDVASTEEHKRYEATVKLVAGESTYKVELVPVAK